MVERYLKGVLHAHFDPKKLPSVSNWTAERNKLTTERSGLNLQYNTLKDVVTETEQSRKSVYSILRQEQSATKKWKVEL